MQPAKVTTIFSEKLSNAINALGINKVVKIEENIKRDFFISNFFLSS